MELRITGLYKGNSDKIIGYKWLNEADKKSGTSKNRVLIEWIENRGGRAYIINKDAKKLYLSIRVLPNGERTIQSSKNGTWSNDLSNLAVSFA